MNSPKLTDHRDCPTVAVVGDDQPLGEHPPIATVDLYAIEQRFRALAAMQLALGALAHYIGVDVFPSFSDELAELLHLPTEARA